MPYTGTDPTLIDIQAQITNNLKSINASNSSVRSQVKQVVLTLEEELKQTNTVYTALLTAFNSGASFIFTIVPSTAASTGKPGQLAYDANYLYLCISTNTWKRVALSTW